MIGSTLRRKISQLQEYIHVPLFLPELGRTEQGGYEYLCTTALYRMALAFPVPVPKLGVCSWSGGR